MAESKTPIENPAIQRSASIGRRARHRLWFPSGVALLTAVAIACIHLQPELERNFKGWLTAATFAIAFLLGLIWFAFFSRISGKVRWTVVALLALTAFGLSKALRVDGTVNGTGLPRLAWRWNAPRERSAQSIAGAANRVESEPPVAAGLADAPQFFGPHRDGTTLGARLSRDWNSTPPKELWRHAIGAGWSAFAVVGGRAYTQEQRGEDEAVTCYEALTGRLLWAHSHPAHFSQWQGGDGPRATPTVEGGQVFAVGATGILECLDARTGEVAWSRDTLKENHLENLTWGVSGSPLVFENTVIVTGGQTSGPSILAYRRATGEPLWKAGMDRGSYASPVLATVAGRRVVLSVNAGSLTLHDPQSGEVLLNQPWWDGKMPKAAQPAVLGGGGRIFLSAGYGAGCVLLEIGEGADGRLRATQQWKNLRMKTQFNSVAARGGCLYGLDDGSLACLDVETGERRWKGGRYGSGQTLLSDDLAIVQSEAGPVALAEARPDGFVELGRISALSSKTWNHPTLAGRYLLVRNSEEAVCYELPADGITKSE